MGPSRASCLCNHKTPSIRLSVSPCRSVSSHLGTRPATTASVGALRQHLPWSVQAAQCHSLSVRQTLSCDARRSRLVSTIQAEAADFASRIDRGTNNNSSGRTSQPSREQSAVQFEICRIPGDGSCLFRALAQGVHQLETGETPDLFAWISFLADARQCSYSTVTGRPRGWAIWVP